jgi:hypothetical protein
MRVKTEACYAMGLLICLSNWSWAAFVVDLNNSGTTTLHEISVTPGQSFDVDVNVSVDPQAFDVQFKLAASSSKSFGVEAVQPVSPWTTASNQAIGLLEPESGAYRTLLPDPLYFGPGLTKVATVTFRVDADCTLGEYAIVPTDILGRGLRSVPEYGQGTAGPDFVVHVVPEPTGSILLLLGAVSFRRFR